MAPFSFSVAVSFGTADPLFFGNGPRRSQSQDDETHVSQTFVIGAFLAIFVAQVGVNLIHGVRSGRFQREVLRRQALRAMEQELPGERERPPDEAGAGQQGEQPPTGEQHEEEVQNVQDNVEGDTEHAGDAG